MHIQNKNWDNPFISGHSSLYFDFIEFYP